MANDGAARLPTWRRLSGTGGGLLALSFFLPAVRSCNSDVVPVEELVKVTSYASTASDRAGAAFMYLAPYLFGLIVLVAAALRAQAAQRALGVASLGTLASGIAMLVINFVRSASWGNNVDGKDLVLALPVSLSAAYLVRAALRGDGGLLCVRWFAAALCVLWFGAWVISGSARYGVVLSFLGSAAIAAGAAGELHALTGLGRWALLWRIGTASIELPRPV